MSELRLLELDISKVGLFKLVGVLTLLTLMASFPETVIPSRPVLLATFTTSINLNASSL